MLMYNSIGCVTPLHALVRHSKFEIIKSSHTRLCSSKSMLTVNGQSPGPTIYATRGDLVIIDVVNRADQNITIHWHGVKMKRYPWSDGPNFVTQCPIRPGQSFRQRMILSDEEGTLWWHAHSDWSRNTVYGAILILPPTSHSFPFPNPHAHIPILIGEWWKGDVQQMMEEFLSNGDDPRPSDAFLINGQPGDLYSCSTPAGFNLDTYKLSVEFGKTYLIRLVNAVMDSIMFFKIAGHNFTVVGTDATYTKPLTTDYVAISPGQTIDLLLEANQPPSHYYMAARVYASGGVFVTTPATAIIEYGGNDYTAPPFPLLPSFPEVNNSAASINFTKRLRSLADAVEVPKNITKKLFYTLSMNRRLCRESRCVRETRLVSSINNVSMILPETTNILEAYYKGGNNGRSATRYATAVSVLEYNSTVEVVFQATNIAGGVEHPMHLHGHSFYVVGSGLHTQGYDSSKKHANGKRAIPGPTIYATRGDLVIIDVVNRADQNITIHW
uniref:laccase n=1 Tax=Salvia miltiorrhiza TaxID=226208 RepID=A0A4Y5RS51_SALMI|nr:laccase 46 [Salvia miltiorrhiza]